MNRYARITPEGTKDYLLEECDAIEQTKNALAGVFQSRGYRRVMPPHLEFIDVYRNTSASWLTEKLYTLTDSRGRLLALRPDATSPIARIAATRMRDARLPLRLYYHETVFRRSRLYAGHSDAVLQSGVELLGADGLRADLEIFLCAVDALRACGASRFRIEIGHAGIFKALVAAIDIDDVTKSALAQAIESKNSDELEILLQSNAITATDAFRALPRLFGDESVLRKAKTLFRASEALQAVEYLQTLIQYVRELDLMDYVDIDLGLVHGQSYYTGFVFRGYMEGSGLPVLSGGRYDQLLRDFGRPAPAIGFALDVHVLAQASLLRGEVVAQSLPDILVFGMDGFQATALRRLHQLESEGHRCEYSIAKTKEEAYAYAAARKIPRVVVLGGGELEESI